MAALVLFVDLTSVVAISTFALLFNYTVTNISAYKLNVDNQRHRALPMLGLATCIMLLVFVLFASTMAFLAGVVFLFAGAVYYFARRKLRQKGT